VKWQYKTILFEYKKDGLLGDRYIDDEETENVLNEQGSRSWELVGITPVQEGLLSFFKRALPQPGKQAGRKPEAPGTPSAAKDVAPARPVIRQPPGDKQTGADPGRKQHEEGSSPDMIGEIKIR